MLNQNLINETTIEQVSPLVLAYIGDAVYDLMVRTSLVAAGPKRIKDMHLAAVKLVKAQHQANSLRMLAGELTGEEAAIVKRGRNTRSKPPKNANGSDYRLSTGFEALIGYLYLKDDLERLTYIFNRSIEEKEK